MMEITQKPKDPVRKFLFWGILVLGLLASPLHFVYEWSSKSLAVGLFAPVNESIWEHLKLVFWPMLIWWIAGYFILNKKNKIPASQWFLSCLIALLTCLLFIITFYYTYTGALGFDLLIIDIFSLFLGLAVGQWLGYHFYRYSTPSPAWLFISIVLLFLLAAAFITFTIHPPKIPLFLETTTGIYGIE